MNHALMDKDAAFDGETMNLEQPGLAFTCMINNEPIASAGNETIVGWCCRRLGTSYF
jgi:hypothetical protein